MRGSSQVQGGQLGASPVARSDVGRGRGLRQNLGQVRWEQGFRRQRVVSTGRGRLDPTRGDQRRPLPVTGGGDTMLSSANNSAGKLVFDLSSDLAGRGRAGDAGEDLWIRQEIPPTLQTCRGATGDGAVGIATRFRVPACSRGHRGFRVALLGEDHQELRKMQG